MQQEQEQEQEWHSSFIASECTAWIFLDLGMILPSFIIIIIINHLLLLLLLLLLMMTFIQEGFTFFSIWERDPLLDSWQCGIQSAMETWQVSFYSIFLLFFFFFFFFNFLVSA
jgi:hypothetical protein